ncbi:hypothetical protein, partial [Pseudomonas savastanoi]|uniref:hypothetical protein n=1 Tax=Pseudomonas savastanoi TaxID=29438 RepID=UPI0011C47D83
SPTFRTKPKLQEEILNKQFANWLARNEPELRFEERTALKKLRILSMMLRTRRVHQSRTPRKFSATSVKGY